MKFQFANVLGLLLLVTNANASTWRGLTVAPENRCSPYLSSHYSYTQTIEQQIVESMGGEIYGPYTDTCFSNTNETDIEHIVARSEAHDSGLCAATRDRRREFARDPLNLTLASPLVNRNQKGGRDAAEWLPMENRCWFANRVVEIKRKYGLTVDLAERDALEAVLANCASTGMIPIICPNRFIPHIAQGLGWETRLYFINRCSQSTTFQVDLKDRDGRPKPFVIHGSVDRYDSIYNGVGPMLSRQTRRVTFPDTGAELIQGYGQIVDNGDDCVAVEVEYRQHLSSGDILFATVPEQAMNRKGTVLTLAPPGCQTGIAVAAGGQGVALELYDEQGHLQGHADLGTVYHDAF